MHHHLCDYHLFTCILTFQVPGNNLQLGLNKPFKLKIAVHDNVDDYATNKYTVSMFCHIASALFFVKNEC